ncbi:MAG: CHAP domain-containing protein [Candidatus Dormibacteraeota bacterium]|nr:CHAP domain-containing protein [Candidatus Dormibacteraeota bacterium]
MRGSRKLLSIVLGCGALLSISVTAIPTGRAATSPTTATLQQQRAQLLAQLAALEPAKNTAGSSLSQAETAFSAVQGQLLAGQSQLTALNARLLTLSGQVAADEATISNAKQQLGVITRQTYESTDTNSWVAAVLSASSFNQAVDRLTSTSHLAGQVSNLQARLRTKEQSIVREKAQIASDAAASTTLEHQLGIDSNALLLVVEQRNAAFQSASAPARALEARITVIDQEIAGNAPRPSASGSCGNHFAYGQCTWYVASRRCIPWVGNADQWYYNAPAYGYAEGHSPAVGAVVVFWPGGDGASGIGHVAYVEAVGPAAGVPAGYFRQSEMNFAGWNRVSYRILPGNSSGIQGFIYAK